jgi:hypothetical protein
VFSRNHNFIAIAVLLIASAAGAQDITFTEIDKTIPFNGQTIVQGDINRDGYPDLLIGLGDSLNIYTYKSDGKGNYVDWTIPTTFCPALPVAMGDLQRNGSNDLLVSGYLSAPCANANNFGFSNYANNGHGIYQPLNRYDLEPFPLQGAVLADFTGDRKLDMVSIRGPWLELEYGTEYGNFSAPYKIHTFVGTPASMTGAYYNLIAGDFDANGCPDVAWTETEEVGIRGFKSQLKVAYGDCHGHFSISTPYDVVGEIDNLQTADLNRDGISDIVASLDVGGQGIVDPTIQISYGQKNRTFGTKRIKSAGFSGYLQIADFNGDGYPDIAYIGASSSSSAGTVTILEGDAIQSFTRTSEYFIPGPNNPPFLLVSGDYNRDGKPDLAFLATQLGEAGDTITRLLNASPFPSGACVPPVTPGIIVCSPGKTSGTTVHVLAAGTNPNPTVYMELWVDGVKKLGYGSTHELRGTLNLAAGTHRFTYFSYDAAGIGNTLDTSVVVK